MDVKKMGVVDWSGWICVQENAMGDSKCTDNKDKDESSCGVACQSVNDSGWGDGSGCVSAFWDGD
eukprot:4062031-Ditylum_brightwellii.AAC.2